MNTKHQNLLPAFALLSTLAAVASAQAPAHKPSPKKGFGVVVRPDAAWKNAVTKLHVRWFYSWGGDEPAHLPAGVEFVPMWGYYGSKSGSLVRWLVLTGLDRLYAPL